MASVSHLSDDELLLLLKRDDKPAFSEIYNRYWEKMVTYSIRLTRSEDESADIVQEIFISLWNRRLNLSVKGSLAAYLIKSTRNLSLRYIERHVHSIDFFEKLTEFIVDRSQNIEENISLKELQDKIEVAITKLPKKMQQVYLLSRDEQLSHREISEKLFIAEGTVKKQINNALKIISESLNGRIPAAMTAILMHLLK